jgi:hypothetical protein
MAASCGSSGGGSGTGGTTATGGVGQGGAGASASGGSPGTGGSGTGTGGVGTGGVGTGGVTTGTGGATGGAGGQAAGTGGTAQGGSGGKGGAAGGAAGKSGSGGVGGVVGTGGGAGKAGSGGASGGSAGGGGVANPVTPTAVAGSSRYRLAFGDVVLEVDAMVGGRVSTLSLSGTNIIMPAATDPTTWGSVFWTSPRSAWTPQTWPPPAAIDNSAYTGSISGSHVLMAGTTDTSIGVSMNKDYAADATSGWISINYIVNATKAIKAAPWEVSRVPRGGIAFFPLGSTLTKGPLTVTQTNGIVWFDDSAMTATSPDGSKLAADGANGWTAYVLGGNLFLKKFADVPANMQAAGEGEIGVYPGAGFNEFEVQGPYTSIAVGGHLPWSIQWRVVKVPSSVTIAVGSTTLVDFVNQQLAL